MSFSEQYKEIYEAAFGSSPRFDSLLFKNYSAGLHYITEKGRVAAGFFLLPCLLEKNGESCEAYYLYAAATASSLRGKGFMTQLLQKLRLEYREPIFLKPASASLIDFYSQRGFASITASPLSGDASLRAGFSELAELCRPEKSEYTAMCCGELPFEIDRLCFANTLE